MQAQNPEVIGRRRRLALLWPRINLACGCSALVLLLLTLLLFMCGLTISAGFIYLDELNTEDIVDLETGLIGSVVGVLAGGARETSVSFLMALSEENYAAAYDEMTPGLQERLVSVERFEELMSELGNDVVDWTMTAITMGGNIGAIKGNVEFQSGVIYHYELELEDSRDGWQIDRFDIGTVAR